MSGFTDKEHLATYAYNDAERLAAREAIYQFLQVDSVDLGTFPFRADSIVGVVSTFLDPTLRGAALDIGCGTGKYLPLLATQFEQVVAADLSAGMLSSVPDGPWEKTVADVEAMAFADDSFSVVLANHMLYHCPNIGSAVAELHRVLRSAVDGGVLIATTNGDGNMVESYELLAKAASAVLGQNVDPLVPSDSRFTLETGSVALKKSFESVTIHRTNGALIINNEAGLNILRAYFCSIDDEWAARYGIDWFVLEAALNVVFEQQMKTEGEIRISTSSGVLVAR